METIAEKIGLPALLEQCAEECAELAQACLKIARLYRGENPTPKSMKECRANLEEEIADVLLTMRMVIDDMDVDLGNLEKIIDYKVERWDKRIDEAKEKVK